ncbi:MAG: hypothetical protein RL698_2466 [Pseudomonadota bacterium]
MRPTGFSESRLIGPTDRDHAPGNGGKQDGSAF